MELAGSWRLSKNQERHHKEVTVMPLVNMINPDNPVAIALRNYRSITTYKVTLRSKSHSCIEEIRYYYKSGHIRMEFIKPLSGVVLIYNPVKKEVSLKPFKFTDYVVTLSPDNNMILSSAGHRVDESDIGSFLGIVAKLQTNGKTFITGYESLSGRQTLFVRVTGNGDFTVRGIHRHDLWLDKMTYLPLKIVSYDIHEGVTEEVLMDDLEIDLDLPDSLFQI